MNCLAHFVKFLGLLCLAALGCLFFQFNVFAMQFASSWQPGSGHIVFLALTAVEAAGFVYLYLAWSPKRAKLLLRSNPTQEQLDVFAAEMRKRLHENSLVRASGLSSSDPDYVSKALEVLDKKAEEIIRQDSRKIFLGTALAQNGRLDALIVFVALSRMIWRISKVYNQRPTPAEIWSVYTTVSSTAFIAFSLDALDIPTTVAEAMNSLVPAVGPHVAGTTLPFMGTAMHLFSSSILDGAANGLLAIRAGILTKNAFKFSTLDEPSSRAMSTKEITQAMLALSKECITDIVGGLKDQVKNMGKSVTTSCVEKTKGAASAVVNGVGSAAETVGEAVASAVNGAGSVGGATVSAVKTVASTVGETVSNAGAKIKHGGETVASAVSSGAETTADLTSTVVKSGIAIVQKSGQAASEGAKKALQKAGSLLERFKHKKAEDSPSA